jgi:hypothetical protein
VARITFPRGIGVSTRPVTVECRPIVATHWRDATQALENGQRESLVEHLRAAVLRAHEPNDVDPKAFAATERHEAALVFLLRGRPAPGIDTNFWLLLEAAFDAIAGAR